MNMRYRNAMQRDPNLAKAFDNLAGLFAPPSGSDFAASANARATNQNAARIADLYSRAGNAGLTPAEMAALDQQMAVQNGGWQNSRWRFQNDSATTLKQTGLNNATTLEQERIKGQNALTLQNAQPVTANQNQAVYLPGQTQTATGLAPVLLGPQELDRGKAYDRPDGAGGMTRVMGPAMPRTMDEAKASVFDQMSPRKRNAIVWGGTPVEQVIMEGNTTNVTRPESLDQTPVVAAPTVETFVAPGPDNKPVPFSGRVGPDGRIINVDTGQVVPNAIKYERSSGTSLTLDKNGGLVFQQGNVGGLTNSRQTDLARASDDNTRTSNEMVSLIRMIRPDDIGVAGNLNKLLTNYGAQLFPGLARPDVIARVTQLEASILGSARALAQDDRLSDGDRIAVAKIAGSTGVGESFAGVQAKLATLAVMTAYRAAYADKVREGQRLPNLDRATLGKLIDQGRIPADVALMYVENNFTAREPTTGPIPGVQTPQLPGAAGAAAPPAQPGAPQQPVRVNTIEEASQLPSGTPIILPDGSPGRVP
jgi:hypothetical protein